MTASASLARVISLAWALALALALTAVCPAPAGAQEATVVGKVFDATGQVRVVNQALNRDLAASKGLPLLQGDTIITGPDSQARLVLIDDSLVRVGDETTLEIDQYKFSPQDKVRDAKLNLPAGKVKLMVNDLFDYKDRTFQVKTPTAVAGVRGTITLILVLSPTQTLVFSFDNPVWAANLGDLTIQVVVQNRTLTYVTGAQPPTPPRPPNPQEWQMLQGLFASMGLPLGSGPGAPGGPGGRGPGGPPTTLAGGGGPTTTAPTTTGATTTAGTTTTTTSTGATTTSTTTTTTTSTTTSTTKPTTTTTTKPTTTTTTTTTTARPTTTTGFTTTTTRRTTTTTVY